VLIIIIFSKVQRTNMINRSVTILILSISIIDLGPIFPYSLFTMGLGLHTSNYYLMFFYYYFSNNAYYNSKL
jgi:hypothetical protein